MGSETEPGILACGAYVPRWRISGATISSAIGWARGRSRPGKGSRSFCNGDEDAITMAVEACRNAMGGAFAPGALDFASTSLPFADRSNSGVIREALAMDESMELSDRTGSRRCGTTALLQALRSERPEARIVCASDCVDARPGSDLEMELGHGAAALVTGSGEPIARLLAARQLHEDFIDQYRMQASRFDYKLEARWLRDAGTRVQLTTLIRDTMSDAGRTPGDIDWLLMPASGSTVKAVTSDLQLDAVALANDLDASIGICTAAHPLLQLSHCLASATEGQLILMVGVGQGFDVLLLEVQAAVKANRPAWPAGEPTEETNYTRYLGVRGLLDIDGGLRSERDNRSSQSAAYRHHVELNGFLGGRCSACGKLQFPATELCVHCHAAGTQTLEAMSGMTGIVNSFTEDWLAYCIRPPLVFGNVHFPGGANVMLEFTDFLPGELAAGQPVRMAFRIKDLDDRRAYRRYFWKPAPGGPADG